MISHQRRVVFIHIPKCGGTSVEEIFVEDVGLTWAQPLRYFSDLV